MAAEVLHAGQFVAFISTETTSPRKTDTKHVGDMKGCVKGGKLGRQRAGGPEKGDRYLREKKSVRKWCEE